MEEPHSHTMNDLIDIMRALRDKETGCPWDLEQNWRSLIPFTLEEAYEVADAIENGNSQTVCDELGDLLFQIVFYAQIAFEEKKFNFADVVANICEKMIRRHPHVFDHGDGIKTASDVEAQWDAIKSKENRKSPHLHDKDTQTSVLDDVTKALPALLRAQKLKKRAAKIGFDWDTETQFRAKIKEELDELYEAIDAAPHKGKQEHVEEEFGDLLFCISDLARRHGINAEEAMRKGNEKFYRRFTALEKDMNSTGKSFHTMPLDEFMHKWGEVKKAEKAQNNDAQDAPFPQARSEG